MLLAGCPERRCHTCRAPWVAPLDRRDARATRHPARPTCTCNAPSEPGLVLDPFLGSGTTALVATRLNRDWLGIELNPSFIAMAEGRLAAVPEKAAA